MKAVHLCCSDISLLRVVYGFTVPVSYRRESASTTLYMLNDSFYLCVPRFGSLCCYQLSRHEARHWVRNNAVPRVANLVFEHFPSLLPLKGEED